MALKPSTRKTVTFALFFVVWLVADLWSKHWADTALADPFHPLPLVTTSEDAGKTLKELVASRLGVEGAEADAIASSVVALQPAVPLVNDAPIFGPQTAPDARGFYVFWRSDQSLPPRRVDRTLQRTLRKWLRMGAPKASPETREQLAKGHLDGITTGAWLVDRIPRVSESDAAELVTDRMHPVPVREQPLSPDAKVEVGTTYLVTQRRIDVMGEWFKFVYAENPGAAFGFMRGVDPGVRSILFFILSIVAFLVILVISSRMPTGARVVNFALSAILAGAVGNFIDRLRYGYVIDFIDMDLGFTHWPTYNVADIAITVGVLLLIGDMLFNKNSPLVAQKDQGPKGKKAKAKARAKA